jgi:uncharacterized protein YjbI with pentapeptide repeats
VGKKSLPTVIAHKGAFHQKTTRSFLIIHQHDLSAVNLSNANLSSANLPGADLSGAKGVTDEQLGKAKTLEGAIMPDGSKHPK